MSVEGSDSTGLENRARLANDPHRPRYHFLPPANWMNDPNGLIQWHGRFHLFYPHNPLAPAFGTIHWGHALSEDLVHWRDLPLALSPTPGSDDESGVWSGCAVDANGTATVVYTAMRKLSDGTRSELPCLATSTDDDLRTWRKHSGNPIIASSPPGLDVLGFRDHSIWREDAVWYQAIGSGIRDVGGVVLLYRSPDLEHWEYVGPLFSGDREQTGEMWECPDVFPFGEGHVVMVSPIPLRKTIYFTGAYGAQRFTPLHQGVVDDGGCFYAPQSFSDSRSRRIMFGWLRENRDEDAQRAAGWAGVMSLPRLLLPRGDGRLGMRPVPELHMLRRQHAGLRDVSLDSARPLDMSGAALELVAEIAPGDASQVGVRVRCTPDGAEQTVIVYDPASRSLSVDRERSSLSPATERDIHATLLELADAEPLRLHIFVDHSVLEVFANGQACLTSRVYPTQPDSQNIELFASGGSAQLTNLDVWQLASIWPAPG
jgi:beta-fructofuranosidase